jgi:hypothetical protein
LELGMVELKLQYRMYLEVEALQQAARLMIIFRQS